MKVPTSDARNATRLLADGVDELRGVAAALMAHVAHITGDGFTEHDFRLVRAAAENMVPGPIGTAQQSAPKLHARIAAELLWSKIQELRTSRSAGA
jgi:hypothetical protein